jgi:sugar lactone lactonase YvrE
VYKVNPHNGRVKLFADDVMSPTGLDMDDDGHVYVASLFGEGVLRLSAHSGKQTVVLPGMLTADVDIRGESIYATVNSLPAPNAAPDGRVVKAPLND